MTNTLIMKTTNFLLVSFFYITTISISNAQVEVLNGTWNLNEFTFINEENTSDIDEYCTEEGVVNLGHVPFDPEVTKSMVAGQPIVVFKPDSPAAVAIRKIWERLLAHLES